MERKWWTLVAVCVGTFMLLLDVTIVNVKLFRGRQPATGLDHDRRRHSRPGRDGAGRHAHAGGLGWAMIG